jgi:uncharacterized protein (DUF433 family)
MQPRFTFAEAGRMIGRQPGTLRRWALGHDRTYRGLPRHDPPLIDVDGDMTGEEPPLSFLNLIELRFLASWRENVTLPNIRHALRFASEALQASRPLLQLEFKQRGRDLFVRYEQQLVRATPRAGQLALADDELVGSHWPHEATVLLDSLDYDSDEHATYRWWPLGRQRPVVLDTRINSGRPTTAATGVRTIAIATRLREGWDLAEITEDTSATPDEIRAAARVEGLNERALAS